jgi:hypothetical protein
MTANKRGHSPTLVLDKKTRKQIKETRRHDGNEVAQPAASTPSGGPHRREASDH